MDRARSPAEGCCSFSFLASSLDKLVELTPKDQFKLMKEHFNTLTDYTDSACP
jgi:hypothetical protein